MLVSAVPSLPAIFLSRAFPFSWFWGFWLGGIAPLIVLAYFVLAESLFQQTIGKELMGLRVARLDGKHVDLWFSLVRNISKIAFIPLVLDVAVGLGTQGDGRQEIRRPLRWNHGRKYEQTQNNSRLAIDLYQSLPSRFVEERNQLIIPKPSHSTVLYIEG